MRHMLQENGATLSCKACLRFDEKPLHKSLSTEADIFCEGISFWNANRHSHMWPLKGVASRLCRLRFSS